MICECRLFVGIIVSLSSTTVAANNLTHSEHDAPHGRGLLGVLLMQDVYLGLVVAATPMLASFDSVFAFLFCMLSISILLTWQISLVDILMLTLKLAGSFLLLALLTALITKVNSSLVSVTLCLSCLCLCVSVW